MMLDFYLCPKCGRRGLSWDARAKVIMCLYHKCRHVIEDVEMAGDIPTHGEIARAINKKEKK